MYTEVPFSNLPKFRNWCCDETCR